MLNRPFGVAEISIQTNGRQSRSLTENGSRQVFRGKRKFVIIAAGTAAAVAAAGAAYAMWSGNGSGSGSSKALTATTVTVNAGTATADLYPGFAGGDLSFTLTNTNPYPITFSAMTPGTITSSAPAACPASNLTVSSPTGLSILSPANSTGVAASITDVATLASAAPDGCQGVTFTVALSLTGSQS